MPGLPAIHPCIYPSIQQIFVDCFSVSGARETDVKRIAMYSILRELPFGWGCQLNELKKANKTINNCDKGYEGKKQGARENDAVGWVGYIRVVRKGAEEVPEVSCVELGNAGSVLSRWANPLAVLVSLFR